jgi:hypothetical protein
MAVLLQVYLKNNTSSSFFKDFPRQERPEKHREETSTVCRPAAEKEGAPLGTPSIRQE